MQEELTMKERINEVMDFICYLNLMGSFVPYADFKKIKNIVVSTYDFLKNSPEEDVADKLPGIKSNLKKMAMLFLNKYPLKTSISQLAYDYNMLFKEGEERIYYRYTIWMAFRTNGFKRFKALQKRYTLSF